MRNSSDHELSLADGWLAHVEERLRNNPLVEDCAVRVRRTETGRQEMVAYIVPNGPFDPAPFRAYMRDELSRTALPDAYVPVSALPLTPAGRLDELALARMEVIDDELVARWEEALRAVPGVDQVSVIAQAASDLRPAIHLSDLIPDWKAAAATEKKEAGAKAGRVTKENSAAFGRLSLSNGVPVQWPAGAPENLQEALRLAADRQPRHGMIYVQSDGREIAQTYPELLADAERILAGLRKLELKPGDKVLFQLEHNQDFIPAFWGCLLGGFVPVPVSIAPTYDTINANVSKLKNAWLMLDHPVVLSSRSLAPSVRSIESLVQIQGLRVEIIDDLRRNERDSHWHIPDPGDLAILLPTSGSTGKPKGVQQSHRAILSRSTADAHNNRFTDADISFNWFPMDHVGGIVMFHIRDVVTRGRQVHAPTQAILREPLKWLDQIQKHRVTITWAPNFAYGLVNALSEEVGKRKWDLSSLRFILNAGEAIVAKTARRFLELLVPHGLPRTAMKPSWGMSETCSAVTYNDNFLLETTSDSDKLVQVGTPIPGFAFRIVDDQGNLVEEGKTGRLEVRGPSVTSGYYRSPELNAEIFDTEHWFNTGDLGIVRDGSLTISGRQKDVIIINGVNFYSHEIEAEVEEIPGVAVSFTAACAVRDPGANTDDLAVFFHTPLPESSLPALIKDIRGRVVRRIGVNPKYLIPVPKEIIPKTEIGKIQRTQLRARYEAGEFAGIVKRMDILTAGANTLPGWFHGRIWRRRELTPGAEETVPGDTLIFADTVGLGVTLAAVLSRHGANTVVVEQGMEFGRLEKGRYQIAPGEAEHYARLLDSIARDGCRIENVFHCWTYEAVPNDVESVEELERAQERGLYSLVNLTRVLSRTQRADRPTNLLFVSASTQAVSANAPLNVRHSALPGVMNTVAQETPSLHCRHVDLLAAMPVPRDMLEANARRLLRELRAPGEREVVYRPGSDSEVHRLVPRLETADLVSGKKQDLPFSSGGIYLITGGLGGVAVEVAKVLLARYHTKLILTGRTELPPRHEWERYLKRNDTDAARIRALKQLETLGAVRYDAVDVCDLPKLRRLVADAEAAWGGLLRGVLHLAGEYSDRLLADETRETLSAAIRAKVRGTWTLHELIQNRPDAIFIGFSSVVSYFGGAMAGAYAAANRFLEAACHSRRQRHGRSTCCAWSTWNELGMSAGYQGKGALRARGVQDMTPEQGVNSLLAALHHEQPLLFVGLDGSNPFIRRHLEEPSRRAQELCAYYTGKATAVSAAMIETLTVPDRFGTRSQCEVRHLPQLPLAASGTIDKQQLADFGWRARRGGWERLAPRTATERQIAAIWQEVLSVPQVGISDNFFELGGHSLLATQVITRLRDAFGVELPLRNLFESPTVAALAAIFDARRLGQAAVHAPALVPVPRHGDLPLSFAQERLWFLDQLEPDSPVYVIPFLARLHGRLSVTALERALTEILRRHEALRTVFALARDGRPSQVIRPPTPLPLPVTDMRHLPDSEREAQANRLMIKHARQPFDLAKGPLLRGRLLRLAEDDWTLLLTMHHIASDGWSNVILARELTTLYNAFLAGKPSPLPEPSLQYADYSVWQREWMQAERMAEHMAYWKQQLAGAPAFLDLPADKPRPPVQSFQGAKRFFVLSPELLELATALTRKEGVTLYIAFQAAFIALLHAYTGQEDISLGSPIANRSHGAIENMIGFFANTLVYRTKLNGDPTFSELLGRVKETALGAYAHQDVPFEKLVEALRPPRDLSRNPLFQVNFRVVTAKPPALELTWVPSSLLELLDNGTSKFDLALELSTDGIFGGYIEYSTALFEPATIDRMLADFERLLHAALAHPDTPLSVLKLRARSPG